VPVRDCVPMSELERCAGTVTVPLRRSGPRGRAERYPATSFGGAAIRGRQSDGRLENPPDCAEMDMQMRAVGVFPASREVRLMERPDPRITSVHDLRLRMLDVGVCGTDRDLCAFRFGSTPPGCDHFVLGHESLAEVVETGEAVTTLRPGDLAVGVVRRPCDDPGCLPCRAGRQDFCATGRYRERGIQDMHGFMTEFVIEEERYVFPVPQSLRDTAVLIEPLTIAEKAFLNFQAIDARLPWRKEQRTAVVLGAGPVGLLGAMLFRLAGFDTRVYSCARFPNPKAAIVESIRRALHFIP
jgi:threonine dehydrogenase-like Zn-dependent dehydrogenase